MILTLIPALMGSRVAATPPEAQAPANAAARPNDGPGFAALFLALLGGSAAPSGDGVAPGRPGAVLHTEAAASSTGAEGGASTEVQGDAFRPSLAVPEGRTTTAGWATLAGAGRPTVEGPAVAQDAAPREAAVTVPVEASSVAEPVGASSVAEPVEGVPSPEGDDADTRPASVERASATVTPGPVLADAAVSSVAGAAAAAPARVTDVRTADRALEKLDPELRAKVERVIERMASEHGHKVEVVEGYRSSERQRFLYAQGRTRPGPVVTWTKESLHMDGHAADLKVEGPWAQRDAYVHLQRIAKEEGLGTLGMKDPGHVELLQDGATRTASRGERFPGEGGRGQGAGGRGQGAGEPMVASSVRVDDAVARTARVARVASVARTARVAAPGTSRMPTPEAAALNRGPDPSPGAEPGLQALPAQGEEWVAQVAAQPRGAAPQGEKPALRANVPADATSKVAEPRVVSSAPDVTPVSAKGPVPVAEGVDRASASPRERREASRGETSAEPVLGGGSATTHHRGPSAPVAGVGAMTGADPLAQVDRVEAVREAMASANPSRVTVRLDGTAGPVDRVQVELLDQALRGQVDVGDADLASKLRGDVSTLMRTLEEKGYDPQALAVKLTANGADATRDGMAGWLRTDSAAQALRTILGAQAGSAGRDAHDRSQGEAHQGRHDPHGTNQQPRRDNRRDAR